MFLDLLRIFHLGDSDGRGMETFGHSFTPRKQDCEEACTRDVILSDGFDRQPCPNQYVREIQVIQARSILHAKSSRSALLCTMTAINSHLYRPGSLGSGMNLDGFQSLSILVLGAPKDYTFGQTAAHPQSAWHYSTTQLKI